MKLFLTVVKNYWDYCEKNIQPWLNIFPFVDELLLERFLSEPIRFAGNFIPDFRDSLSIMTNRDDLIFLTSSIVTTFYPASKEADKKVLFSLAEKHYHVPKNSYICSLIQKAE